jgi:hypothetical protein
MTRNTTLLYVRMPAGRAAAFSPDASLTPELKAMLKAVDGKSSVSALMIQFADQDAADLLGQLESAGLIRLREERTNDFQRPDVQANLPANEILASSNPPSPAADASSKLSATPAVLTVMPEPPATGLGRIVDVMSTFVLTYLPQQAFTVLSRLEGFKTLDELQAQLPEYAALAKSSGPAGIVHLADVAERVREAAAA